MNYDKFTELRKMRGVSMVELAECAGITRQHLINCVKNDTLKVMQIKKICVLLRCKSNFFLINSEKKMKQNIKNNKY